MPNDSIRRTKRLIRREVVDRILAMSPYDRSREERILDRLFPSLPGLDGARTILLFLSHLPEEFETRGMIRWALERNMVVACPRVDVARKSLQLHRVSSLEQDLTVGPFGIPQPKADSPEIDPGRIEWALIPGIAFDSSGYRLGRGAGYYDRLIPMLHPAAPRVSMVLDPQWVEAVPIERHDQPVHGVVGVQRQWFASTVFQP